MRLLARGKQFNVLVGQDHQYKGGCWPGTSDPIFAPGSRRVSSVTILAQDTGPPLTLCQSYYMSNAQLAKHAVREPVAKTRGFGTQLETIRSPMCKAPQGLGAVAGGVPAWYNGWSPVDVMECWAHVHWQWGQERQQAVTGARTLL